MNKIKAFALATLISVIGKTAMADSTTSRIGIVKPTIGSFGWGSKLNNDMDLIDADAAMLVTSNTFNYPNTMISTLTMSNAPIVLTSSYGFITSQSSITTSGSFFGNGSGLTNVSASSATIFSSAAQFSGDGSSPNPLTLKSSSVTLQGNQFNGANQLLQLNGSALVPNATIDGSSIAKLSGAGKIPNSLHDSSSVTLQGNQFNGANQLIQANASAFVPNANIDGSSITKLTGAGLVPNQFIDSSSITKQGNQFNGANQLLQLNSSALIPNANVDGSSVVKLSGASLIPNQFIDVSSVVKLNAAALIPNQYLDSSSITKQGNQFNGASQLLQLNASAFVPNARLDSTSVTLQGNQFNGANQLLQLNSSALIPNANIDGSSIAKLSGAGFIPSALVSGSYTGITTVGNLTGLSVYDGGTFTSTLTVQGNAFSVGTSTFVVTGGKVGIGTAAPSDPLNVSGRILATSGIQGSSGTFSGAVQASTFNAVGSAYQVNGFTVINSGLNVNVSSITSTGDHVVGVGGNASTISASGFITLANITTPAASSGRVYFDSASTALKVSLDGATFVTIATGSVSGSASVVSNAAQFSGDGTGANPLTLKSSSVTLQGNQFNGASQLVKTDSNGAITVSSISASVLTLSTNSANGIPSLQVGSDGNVRVAYGFSGNPVQGLVSGKIYYSDYGMVGTTTTVDNINDVIFDTFTIPAGTISTGTCLHGIFQFAFTSSNTGNTQQYFNIDFNGVNVSSTLYNNNSGNFSGSNLALSMCMRSDGFIGPENSGLGNWWPTTSFFSGLGNSVKPASVGGGILPSIFDPAKSNVIHVKCHTAIFPGIGNCNYISSKIWIDK